MLILGEVPLDQLQVHLRDIAELDVKVLQMPRDKIVLIVAILLAVVERL